MEIKKIKLGLVTIGHSPRKDITEEIVPILGSKFDVIESGALDDYYYNDIHHKFPLCSEKNFMVTKLADGSEIKINEEYLIPLIKKSIKTLEGKGAKIIAILCTADFGTFKSTAFLVQSSDIVKAAISNLGKNIKIGVFIPDDKQYEQMKKRWEDNATNADIISLPPYGSYEETKQILKNVKDRDWDFVLLDCMGYSEKTRLLVAEILNKNVLLSREIVAKYICEIGETY